MIGNISASFASWSTGQSAGTPPSKPDPAKMFESIDADGNGEISESELTDVLGSDSNVTTLLSSFDADGNGTVTQSEFTSSMESVLEQLKGQAGAFGMPPPPPPEDAFSSLDANGDGSVTSTELSDAFSALAEQTGTQGPSAEDFMSRFDTNGDGVLSESELSNAQQRPPGPPPSAGMEDPNSDQQFIATVLNAYMSSAGLLDDTSSSTLITSA